MRRPMWLIVIAICAALFVLVAFHPLQNLFVGERLTSPDERRIEAMTILSDIAKLANARYREGKLRVHPGLQIGDIVPKSLSEKP